MDLTDEEARVLLLSLDPLAALAQTQEAFHERLRQSTPVAAPELAALWRGDLETETIRKKQRP